AVQRVPHGGPGEVTDRVVEVVHAHRDAAPGERGDLEVDRVRARGVGLVGDAHLARPGDDEVGGPVLVAVRVPADDDRLGPAWHEPRRAGQDDGLAEHHAAKDVADGPVRRPPHLLQPELADPGLVRGDRGALDPDAVALDGVRRVHRHLVVGLVAVLDGQVEVLEVDIQVGQDQLVLDEVPDDPRHLVAVDLDDGIRYLDLGHAAGFLPYRAVLAPGGLLSRPGLVTTGSAARGRRPAGRRPGWPAPSRRCSAACWRACPPAASAA